MFTIDQFRKLKAENRIYWDTDSLNKGADEVRSYISSVSNQSQFKGNQWTDDEYNNNRAQAAGMRNRLRALEVYANSIKDKDEGAYRNAMSAHAQLSGALDQVDDWFRSNEGGAFNINWENHRQADKAQKLNKGIDQMRAGSTAKEQAEALGLDEKELETAYKEQLDYENEQELNAKYGKMNIEQLLGELKKSENIATDLIESVRNFFHSGNETLDWNKVSDKDKEFAFEDYARDHNMSVDEVKDIYNRYVGEYDASTHAVHQLGNDEKNYIFRRILETGTAEELEELQKSLPDSKYFRNLRKNYNIEIEAKKEQRYFLDVKEKFPEIDKLIETKENGDEFYRQGFNEEQDPEGFKEYDKANKLLSVYEKMGVDVDKYKQYKENHKNRLTNNMFQTAVSVAADKHPVLTSLASTPVNMIGSLGDVPKVIRAAFDDDYYYDPKGTASYTASNIRSTVSKKIDNPGWEFLYNTGASMSDSAIGIAANYIPVVGQFVSSAMFFSSAGVSAANEVVESGGTPAQAAWTMLAHGGAELVFEKISLEKLNALQAVKNGKGGLKRIIVNTLKQSFTESSEEVATTLANTLTDQIINGDLSAFARSKQAYIDEGLSEKEATAKAVTDWWASLGMDAAGGALSGGVFGALGSTKAHLSYRKAMKNTTVTLGGVEMSAKDALKAAPDHFRELAQKLTENEGFDVKQLTEIAKDASEDGKARTLADSMERTIRKSGKEKITAADVENLLNELYKENIDAFTTGEHIKSALAWAEMDSLTGAEQKKTAVKEFNDSFDLAGKRKAGDPSAASDAAPPTQGSLGSVSSFGEAHPNGIAAFDKSGKEITVKGVDSVVNEYGKGDRTVTFVLGDGSVVDADEVEFTDPDMQQLVELAKSYDTIGARALLSNYEDAKANGVSLETYKDAFAALYDVGQDGTDYEYAVKNPKYEATMQQIGAQAAQAAIEAGNYDADQSAKTQSFMSKRVRVKGRTLNESRVRVERGVTAEISDDLKPVLQLLAEKTGKEIVVTNAMDAEDKGVYSDNRIYLNAAHLSDASVTTALHEAVHNMAAYSAEDFRTLEKFVMNYYAETGVDVDKLKDKIKATYGKDAPTPRVVREEIVAKAVESIVSDEKALRTALECKANKGLIEKIGDILKRIVDFVSKYFKGDKANGLLKHNEYAQAFLDNSEKLQQMAEIISRGFENARANEQTYGSRESVVRLSKVEGDEKKRIKIQLHNAIPILEKMDSVVEIKRTTDSFISKEDLKKDIKELFVDDWIIRNDGLEIEFSKKLVDRAISKYVFTPAERIATYAAPYVIKYGKKIYSEDNHKGNGHPSITFGAPVEIDGVKGYMGVAVLQTTANRYRSHRIISTDDTVFEIKIENVEATGAGNNSPKAVARPAITSTFDIIIPQSSQNSNTSNENNLEGRKSKDDTIYDFKNAQNEIIQKSNPVNVDYLTWIRSAKDINTFEETLKSGEYDEGEDFDPSYTWNMAQKALKSGKITVYSSYPIQQGVFVTPSKMEAQDYAGGGKVYQKTVALTDVAWIDPTQGQYANVNEFNSDPNARKSKDDTIYLSAAERGDMETAQKMVDEAARAAGYDLHLYHGSKSGGGFTVFKDWQYFTANKSYAERYTQRDTGKGMYSAYVKSERMFDTRNTDDRELFEQYRNEYGMGDLQESGLPDWTDGYDLSDIIEENNLDYDGIVLDEGGDLVNGKPVSRGESYVIRNSEQIKSADPVTYDDDGKVIPLSQRFDTKNEDIRYSKDDTIYDFDLLLDNDEDIQDTIRRNPQAAVELIYRNAVDYMQKSFESAGDVVLTDKEIADIAKNMFERLGIDETAGQLSGKGLTFEQRIENFVNQINRINGSNSKYKSDLYRSAFEGLATSLTQYVEALKSTDFNNERQSIYGFIGNRALKLRTDGMPDIELIRRNYGKIDNYRRRVGGKFRVGYEGRVNNGFTIDELIDYVKENHPQLIDDELINRDGGFMWAERLVNQTLGEKIKVGDSGYYEDARSAALEAAMGVASDIMAAQKSGESTADLPVKVTELRRELRKAKRQISELNKRGTVEDKSIKKAVRDEYAKAVRANNDINAIKSIASKMRTMIVNPTDKKFIPEEFLNNTDFLDAFEDVANAVVVNDYSKAAERFAAMVDQLQDMREKAVDKDGDFSEAFDDAFMSDLRDVLKAVKDIDTEGKQGRESRKAKLISELEKLLDTALNGEQFTKQQYRDILDVIHAVEQNDDFDISMLNALQKKLGNVNFENNFAEISKTLSPRKVSRKHLNDKELHQMREALEQVMWRIENARKQLFREDSITHQESGERMIEQIRGLSKHKRKAISRVFAGIDDNFLNPIRLADKAMQYSKDSELQYHINATNEGWRKMTFWAMNAEKAFAELVTQNEKAYKKACNEVISVEYDAKTEVNGKTLTTSKTLEMTRMEAMYLLMAWKREQLSRNMEHLTTGGIVVADPKMEAKGKGKAFEKAAQHLVSKEMIEAVSKYMGDFERSYMRLAENYFNKTAKDAINEVMMAIKHREIARSEYYVPIRVDRDFLNVELDGLKYDAVIENRGSYKETVRSDKPVLVMSLNKIIENHINETAQLYGLAIPLRNFKKALNINTKGQMTEKGWQSPDSVRTAMTAQMGQRAVTVFNRLIEDLNRPRKTDTNKVFSALYQARVKTALVGNFGVVIKQAASYTNAGLYLSAKDLTAGIGKFFLGEKEDGKRFAHFYQKTINEIDKYTGQHYIRRKGMSVQEVADMMNRSKLTRKTPTAINPVKWIQAMDCATTAALWEAVKTHVNTEYKKSGKAVGTAEFFEDVADLYNKVIENTQPMYDPLHRCEFQKSSGDFMKSVFMFTTQPLQNFGILYDAAARFFSDKNAKNAQHLAKAVSSQFSSLLVFSLMTFVAALLRHKWDRYRDENDDITVESFMRTYWSDVFTNAVNNAAPIGGDYGLAIKDDLVKWIGKGDNSLSGVKDKASITLVNDYLTRFSKAAKALSNGKWSFWNVADVPGSLSEFFGVPYNNLSTMFKGAESNIKELATGVPVSNGGELKTDNIKNNIIRNYLNGDSGKAEKLTELWVEQKVIDSKSKDKTKAEKEETARKAVYDSIAEKLSERDDLKKAAEAKFDGRLTEHKQIKEKFIDYGVPENVFDKAVTKLINKMDDGTDSGESKEKPKYTRADAFTALKNGEGESYLMALRYLAQQAVDSGKYDSLEVAETKIEQELDNLTYTKPLFIELENATKNSDREKLNTVHKQLENIFGSTEAWKAAYKEWRKKEDEKITKKKR